MPRKPALQRGERRGTLPFAKIQKFMANMMLSCMGELTIDPLDVFYVYIPQNLIESMFFLILMLYSSKVSSSWDIAFFIRPYVDGHTSQEYKTEE